MIYDLTITFEHGELSLERCSNPFHTEQIEDENFKQLGLGKAKQVTITIK